MGIRPNRRRARNAASAESLAVPLEVARIDLGRAWDAAKAMVHRGARGDEREAAVRAFLKSRLGSRFDVKRAEVIDSQGNRSTQLDCVVFDSINNAPLATSDSAILLPAEAVLGLVEVKSTLSQEALNDAMAGLAAFHALRPFGEDFSLTRKQGQAATKSRVFTTVFGFESDLKSDGWLQAESARVRKAAEKAGVGTDYLDRLVVLDRGLLAPPYSGGTARINDASLLYMWFMHLMNFLAKEVKRRPPTDWAIYAPPEPGRWERLHL